MSGTLRCVLDAAPLFPTLGVHTIAGLKVSLCRRAYACLLCFGCGFPLFFFGITVVGLKVPLCSSHAFFVLLVRPLMRLRAPLNILQMSGFLRCVFRRSALSSFRDPGLIVIIFRKDNVVTLFWISQTSL